ncbi:MULTISPECIES: rhodanese-like domain-containing protein [unclassified Synechococcus]|uniref:rhodanese-like domain-containing protein n=2 Tax=Synechococcales TaxID=1890424 RepID=UPI0009F9F847|nr:MULTISPECIES: rhodanese-like domain-containing protein [unclassified Synechococcus]MCT0202018.1 rhodanese-like domain-containing protein [Synechococcus sp. CS-603]MCT0246222.1 rhodanese-like domain-containing protein [Synechococcus sp. CS-601]MCT4363293.1 rhodanese-like domain-containing protein [Candidatus Regnicoccus frigidus MAG-AL1]MCT4367499.1 rhodanese-like domain-containing protein [Candidatus Regnicoccus frigidus MAG-AL2]
MLLESLAGFYWLRQCSKVAERMNTVPHQKIWASITSALFGVALMAFILLGIGSHPIAMAANTAAATTVPTTSVNPTPIETAVGHYLDLLPANFHAIGSVPAMKSLIEAGNSMLIDVRNPAEYEVGHIPGAINLPLSDLERHLDAVPHDQDVVVYCSTGYRAAMAVMALQLQGFDRVKGFPPGFVGWEAAEQAVIPSANNWP